MAKLAVYKPVIGAIVGLVALYAVSGGAAYAEPAQDSVASVSELSRGVEQLSQIILNAQPDLDKKMELLREADEKYAADLDALEVTKSQLATYQRAVDNYAATAYMGGRTDGLSAMLTAPSPSSLIDELATQRLVSTQMSEQLQGFRRANREAKIVEAASAKSAAEAKAAVDVAAEVRADLENKRAQLRKQLAELNTSYAKLPAPQRAGLTLPSAAATAALGPAAPIPTVGMGGLVPNAKLLADHIMATYPGVDSIGGVRADSLPDHPSGRALDIMVGSDMGLGDTIHADLESQAGRFGIDYTMWRVAAHFDHIHVTVS
nr:cell wall-associated hydrolase, invasion-associated protein [Mycolicibacterium malmesburyense]